MSEVKRHESTNWSIGVMEYWSDGLGAVGVKPRAQGVRAETFLMHTTPLLHYSSTPSFVINS